MQLIKTYILALLYLQLPLAYAIEPSVAAGGSEHLAVNDEGLVYSLSPTTTIVAGLPRVSAVAAGGRHSVALAEDGSVFEWGYSPYQVRAVMLAHPSSGSLGGCEKDPAFFAFALEGHGPNPCAKEMEEIEAAKKVDKPIRIPQIPPAKAVAASAVATVIITRKSEVYCPRIGYNRRRILMVNCLSVHETRI